jgi:hypothetical protein
MLPKITALLLNRQVLLWALTFCKTYQAVCSAKCHFVPVVVQNLFGYGWFASTLKKYIQQSIIILREGRFKLIWVQLACERR